MSEIQKKVDSLLDDLKYHINDFELEMQPYVSANDKQYLSLQLSVLKDDINKVIINSFFEGIKTKLY